MGLFGMKLFGYNERTYAKNSERFKQRIQTIMEDAADRGVNTFGIGKSLSELTIMIDTLKYKKEGPDYEAVDAEIDKLLSAMEDDVREKRMASVVARADLLYRELDEGRRSGKNAFTPEARKAEYSKAEALGRIHSELNRQGQITIRQQKLIDLAAKATEAEQQKYRLEYNALEQEKQATIRNINMWTSTYNTAIKVLGARNTASQLGAFEATKVANLKEFEREMADATKRLERGIEENNAVSDVADEAVSGMDSILGGASGVSTGFDALVEDKKNQNLQQDMGNAPMSGGMSNSVQDNDPFSIAMRNK